MNTKYFFWSSLLVGPLLVGTGGQRDAPHRLTDAEMARISGSETKRCVLGDRTSYQVFDGNVGCARCADALQGAQDICTDYYPTFYNPELLGGGAAFDIYESCTNLEEDEGTKCKGIENVWIYSVLQCDGDGEIRNRRCDHTIAKCDIYSFLYWCEECYFYDVVYDVYKDIFECEETLPE